MPLTTPAHATGAASSSLDAVDHCVIHPGIGIARLGNSQTGFFLGPEAPGVAPAPEGGFKDGEGAIKRQGVRFRIYGYDQQGAVVAEITDADAEITWTVHLVNKKASWYKFHGRYHIDESEANLRNKDVQNTPADPNARAALIIDPGPRSISGPGVEGPEHRFDTGTFLQVPVPLGELRTDEAGRLVVLGGYGHSASTKPDNPLHHYANNDAWFDDTSDGPVTATVTLRASGRSLLVTGASVIVTPPNFVSQLDNIITLYDVAREVALKQKWISDPDTISFTRDIYPILSRPAGYQWVNATALRGHGPGTAADFSDPQILAGLASKDDLHRAKRQAVFQRLRKPEVADDAEANPYYMPQLSGDDGDATEGEGKTWLALLATQYEKMQRWAAGDFEADWTGAPPDKPPLDQIPVGKQPAALDRAALEACVGGPFFPGIEMTYIATDPATYSGLFRLSTNLTPGDITKYMAIPWQADFYQCNTHWWPAHRPDDVVPEAEFLKVVANLGTDYQDRLSLMLMHREPWARGVGEQIIPQPNLPRLPGETDEQYQQRVEAEWERRRLYAGDNDLVEKWSKLGFVASRKGPKGERVFVETERGLDVGLSMRDWFYILQHVDAFTEYLPAARTLTDRFLADAWAHQNDPEIPEMYRFFPYSEEAFRARLDEIYRVYVDASAAYDPATDTIFKDRASVVERTRQLAPFNRLDGAWLRNVTPAGPISEVHSLLFSIWMDEMGDGLVERNHGNLYDELLHSIGIYFPPVDSREFANNPDILDSAYDVPVFELAISQFSQEYFPEILGMTLQLEWEVVELPTTVKLLDYHGISPHFYSMHVGIDNAAVGHGAKAREAVELHLQEAYDRGGDEEVQEQWKRIWNGYLAFATTGTLGSDLVNLLLHSPSLYDRMWALVERKAPVASLNHGSKELGGQPLNDWFDAPRA